MSGPQQSGNSGWFRIITPHFVGAGGLHAGKVTKVAPIISYMNGWPIKAVRDYCTKKRWTLEEYEDE